MQINNIAITAEKCKKPCVLENFKGRGNSPAKEKVRYKHYEEMSDDVLKAKCIVNAHQDAQKSAKMRVYKNIPSIVAGVTVTSLALTQPGKLSAKAATGLGFLATMAGIKAVNEIATSKDETERKTAAAKLGGLATVGAGALMAKNGKGGKGLKEVAGFVSKEANQLANEINSTKLAKFSDKYITPFVQKHPKISSIFPLAALVSANAAGKSASVGLLKSVSEDIKTNANEKYDRAKAIQKVAREHFDSIDAIEV